MHLGAVAVVSSDSEYPQRHKGSTVRERKVHCRWGRFRTADWPTKKQNKKMWKLVFVFVLGALCLADGRRANRVSYYKIDIIFLPLSPLLCFSYPCTSPRLDDLGVSPYLLPPSTPPPPPPSSHLVNSESYCFQRFSNLHTMHCFSSVCSGTNNNTRFILLLVLCN